MIELHDKKAQRQTNIQHCHEKDIILPTCAHLQDPGLIPALVKSELANIGLWDVQVKTLFGSNWDDQAVAQGGGFGDAKSRSCTPQAGC